MPVADVHPEYTAIVADVDGILAKIDTLESRAPNGHWAKSARQHLLNGLQAYKLAFHELPASEKMIAEDLF